MTTVASERRFSCTTVLFPHFEQRNCTFEWPLNSVSFSECSAPQWVHTVCIL